MKKKTILSFLIISLLLLFSKKSSAYFPIWDNELNTTEVNAESSSSDNFLNIESESAILIEQNTGKILYEKNSHELLRPASVTKIMSLLLIMEALDRGDISLDTEVPTIR